MLSPAPAGEKWRTLACTAKLISPHQPLFHGLASGGLEIERLSFFNGRVEAYLKIWIKCVEECVREGRNCSENRSASKDGDGGRGRMEGVEYDREEARGESIESRREGGRARWINREDISTFDQIHRWPFEDGVTKQRQGASEVNCCRTFFRVVRFFHAHMNRFGCMTPSIHQELELISQIR